MSLLKHEQNKHFCDQCSATFKFKSRLERHIESAHLDINYPCGQFDHIATCKEYFNIHMKRNHGDRYQCEVCEYVSNRPNLLRAHIKDKHGSDSEQQQQPKPAPQTTAQSDANQQVSHQFEQTDDPLNLTHSIFNSTPCASTSSEHKETPTQSVQFDPTAMPQPANQTTGHYDVKDLLQAEPQEFSPPIDSRHFHCQSEPKEAPFNLIFSKQSDAKELKQFHPQSEPEVCPINQPHTIFYSNPHSSDHNWTPVQLTTWDPTALEEA